MRSKGRKGLTRKVLVALSLGVSVLSAPMVGGAEPVATALPTQGAFQAANSAVAQITTSGDLEKLAISVHPHKTGRKSCPKC